MNNKEARLCDCPEPCGCYAEGYAAGKDKAFFEMEMPCRTTPTPPVAVASSARSSGPARGRR